MRKILFVNSCLGDGGAERVMTLLANEFVNRKNSVHMILVRGEKKDHYNLDNRIACTRFFYKSKKKISIFISRIFQLRRIIAKEQYDVIISFVYDINLVTILASLGKKNTIIVSERNDPRRRWKNGIFKIFEEFIYRKADGIVFQTEQVRSFYNKRLQDASKVIVNPVKPDIPNSYEGKKEKNIVAVGRLEPQKNFSLLIKTFAKLSCDYPEYKLVIYGEGREREKLQNIVHELGVDDKVELPGYKTDILDRIRNAEVYVSSSDYEGISNTMIEAMALGIPTICTDCPVGGARKMIVDSQNGLLVQVGDEEKLENAIRKILDNPEFAKYISDNAKEVRNSYSIESITNDWEDFIEELINKKGER